MPKPKHSKYTNPNTAFREYYANQRKNPEARRKFTISHGFLLAGGTHPKQIAKAAGISTATVYKHARFLGIEPEFERQRAGAKNRIEQRDPTLEAHYLRFRKTMPQQRAADRTGITTQSALRIERENMSRQARKANISRSRSQSRGDPRVAEMRYLLGIRNQDGYFRFPIKTLRKVFDVWQSPIDRANKLRGTIRTREESLSSARRFKHYTPGQLAQLEAEARKLLKEYRQANMERTERTSKEKTLETLTAAEREKLEAILLADRALRLPRREEVEHGPKEQINSPERIGHRRKIMQAILAAPGNSTNVKQLERSLGNRGLRKELKELSKSRGLGLITTRKNGAVALNPEVVGYLDMIAFHPKTIRK